MKFGFRIPSVKKRIAARTSPKRMIRHNLGLKAPKGFGWLTNPKKALYNRIYNRTSVGCGTLLLPIVFAILLSAIFVVAAAGQTVSLSQAADLKGIPSFDGKTIGTLENGTTVEVIEQRGNWILVQSPETVGWLYVFFVKQNSTVTWPVKAEPVFERDGLRNSRLVQSLSATSGQSSSSSSASSAVAQDRPPTISPRATAKCKDGTYSYVVEVEKRCVDNGGIEINMDRQDDARSTGTARPSSSSPGGPVKVDGYYRKDGTYVRPHTRRTPRSRRP